MKEIAFSLYENGEYEKAIEYYDSVLAIDPNDVRAISDKGDALIELGNLSEGKKYQDKAFTLAGMK